MDDRRRRDPLRPTMQSRRPAPDRADDVGGSCHLAPRRPAPLGADRVPDDRAGRRRRGRRAGVSLRVGPPTRSRCAGRAVASQVPTVVSDDPRLPAVVDQALADLAGAAHHRPRPPRPRRDRRGGAVVHDAVRARLAADVLDDPALRRRPGRRRAARASPSCRGRSTTRRPRSSRARSSTSCAGTAVADRSPPRERYYGTVDATPLFVMLAAEAWRWGALTAPTSTRLWPGGRRCARLDARRRRFRRRRVRRLPAQQRVRAVQPGVEGLVGRRHLRRRIAARPGRSRSSRCRATPTRRCSAPPSWRRRWGCAHAATTSRDAAAACGRFNDAFWDERGLVRDGPRRRRAGRSTR